MTKHWNAFYIDLMREYLERSLKFIGNSIWRIFIHSPLWQSYRLIHRYLTFSCCWKEFKKPSERSGREGETYFYCTEREIVSKLIKIKSRFWGANSLLAFQMCIFRCFINSIKTVSKKSKAAFPSFLGTEILRSLWLDEASDNWSIFLLELIIPESNFN